MKRAAALDGLFRLGYRCAFQALRLYWNLAHPDTHGALVALWHGGRVLLVQNSYVAFRSLPGGRVERGESARQAAVRELREEVGIIIPPDALHPVVDVIHHWEGKRDHVEIFAIELPAPPAIAVDNREVIWAALMDPAAALSSNLFPPVRLAIEAHL
jgi:8-oxo-dGTP diphosphatase